MTKPSAGNDKQIDRGLMEKEARSKLRIVFSSVKKQSREIEERYGMSATQLWMLTALQEHPGLCVSDLARNIHVHNSTASNLLASLEEHSLVQRERSQEDHRVVQLHLTPTGQKFVLDFPELLRNVVSDALAGLSLKTLVTFNQCLKEMVDGLKVKDTDATLTPIAEI